MGRLLRWSLLLIFVLTGISLGVLNPHLVNLNLLIWQLELPLSLIMVAFLMLGLILGAFMVGYKLVAMRWQLRQKNSQYERVLNEVIELKKQMAQQEVEQAVQGNGQQLVNLNSKK